MTLPSPTQVLQKPPRLLNNTTGYDWREFDRWLQRLYLLLGTGEQGNAYNVINSQQIDAEGISNNFLDSVMESKGFDAHSAILELVNAFDAGQSAQSTIPQPDVRAELAFIPKYTEPAGDTQALQWM